MIQEIVICVLLILGTFFMLLGSIGLVRLPDIYTRMHALTKSSTLGLLGLLVASALYLAHWEVSLKIILAISFHFLTNPVGAHMICRAAYHHLKVPFWKNTTEVEWGES